MGLQVWLPLTKDSKNQGLNNLTFTVTGATYQNTGGKLGGCYYFDGVDDRIWAHGFSMSNQTMSAACWVKMPEGSSTTAYIFSVNTTGGGSTNQIGIYTQGTTLRLCSGGSEPSSEVSIVTNQWVHIVFTTDGINKKLYINGVIQATLTEGTTAQSGYNITLGARSSAEAGGGSGVNFMWKGYINDFRLYDHVLSPLEVKHLAQGLVLHYPLAMSGQENLIKNSSLFQTTDYWVNNQNVVCSVENGELKAVINQSDSTPGIRYTESLSSLQSGEYIATVIAKVENGNKDYISYPFYIANVSTGAYQRESIGNGYYKYTKTFSVSSAIQVSLYIITSGSKIGETWYIKSVKLERGSHPTPWIPNPADPLYSSLGFNDGIEYDVSGYGRNGTMVSGSLSWSSDSARYSLSTYFNGSSYFTATSLPSETKTISFWIKATIPSGSAVAFADYGSKIAFGFFGGNSLIVHCGSSNGSTGSRVLFGTNIWKTDDWNHVVIVKTGTGTYTTYLNNVVLTPDSANFWTHSSDNFMIGRRSSGSYFTGYLSDLRAYATALTADQVKQLYEAPISLANNGTLLTQGEYVES